MAMKGERMKDAGDGDGEGGGEISTPSNSDLHELARRQGEWDKGSGLLEEKGILTEKNMRQKESTEKVLMEMTRKEREEEREMREKVREMRKKEMREKVREKVRAMDTEVLMKNTELATELSKRETELWERDTELWERETKLWERETKLWEREVELWESGEREVRETREMRKKETREKGMRVLMKKTELARKLWKREREMERELRVRETELWERETELWERETELWERERKMESGEWGMRMRIGETQEMLGRKRKRKRMREKEERMSEERMREEMLKEMEMEMLVIEEEEDEELWKKMKEKEPKPLQDWEMGMEKCPCLLGWCRERKGPVLYFFNLLDERKSNIREYKKDEDGKRPGTQVITLAESITLPKYYNMSVVVGSVLYVLGGGALEHPENEQDPENEQQDPENEQEWSFYNDVFLCDTNHPQKRWIKGPDMLNHRCNGKAVAVESKIYVFGGNNKKVEDRPWAEFLDPDKNKWEPLPAPPADSLIHTRDLLYNPVVYGSPGKEKIFLSCCYYIYDVNDRTWQEFCAPESLRPFSHNVTSDGSILYWSHFGHLYSFHMKTQDIDCGLVEGYKLSKYREELLFPEPTLLHLDGDYFCFITLKDLPEDCTKVRFTKFQVSHQGGLKASVVYRDTYTIDCPLDIDCSYAFVLNGKLGAEKSEGSSVF